MDEVVSRCENPRSTSGPTMLDWMTHRWELYAEEQTVGTRCLGRVQYRGASGYDGRMAVEEELVEARTQQKWKELQEFGEIAVEQRVAQEPKEDGFLQKLRSV